MNQRIFSLRENLLGLIQPSFLIGSGILLLCSIFISSRVEANRFCTRDSTCEIHCVPCPEHAECIGSSIARCEHGLLNDGYQCLSTTLDEPGLAELHDQIIDEYSKSTTRTAEEIYSLFSEAVFPSDFNSALAYHGSDRKSSDGRIVHNLFSFVRTRSPLFPIRRFTLLVGALFAFSLTGFLLSHLL
jgi:hypothetical protein